MNESMGPRLLFKHLGDLDCTGADGNSKGKINNLWRLGVAICPDIFSLNNIMMSNYNY